MTRSRALHDAERTELSVPDDRPGRHDRHGHGAFALVPLATFSVRRRAIVPGTANRVYVVNMVLWILFTLYVGLMVFRGILRARRVRSNEIFVAINVGGD